MDYPKGEIEAACYEKLEGSRFIGLHQEGQRMETCILRVEKHSIRHMYCRKDFASIISMISGVISLLARAIHTRVSPSAHS